MSKNGTRRSNGEGSIRERKNKGIWEASYTDPDGNRRYITGKREQEVRKKLTAAMARIDKGAYTAPDKMTVDTWVEEWLFEFKKRTVTDVTFDNYYKLWKLYLSPELGHFPLQKLRGDHIQRMVNRMIDRKLSPATVKYTFAILSSALKKAHHPSIGLIDNNPAYGTELPPPGERKIVVLTADEQRVFMTAAKNSPLGDIFLLMLYTGMRPGEILGLKWSEVDFNDNILRVRRIFQKAATYDESHNVIARKSELKERTKSKAGKRDIPLLPDAVMLLQRMRANQLKWCIALGLKKEEYPEQICVIPPGKPVTLSILNHALRDLLKKSDLPTISPHKLRHTFATRGLENDINPKVMQEILGHSTIAMTMDTYSHVLPDVKRAELEKMKGAF